MVAESKGSPTAKELAAQARAAAQAQERRRERMIRIIGSLVVVIVVGGLLAVGFFAGRDGGSTETDSAATKPDKNAALPLGVTKDKYGVQYGSGWDAKDEAKLPTLELWEDFQCPACKQVEDVAGKDIKALAEKGAVKLLFRPATFLDDRFATQNKSNGNPRSSARATSAWGCAIDQKKTGEFHSAIFAAQPNEGLGYSDQTLIDLGTQVGVGDPAAFGACVKAGKYLGWAANSQQGFVDSNAGGTPTGYLNGVELDASQLANIATLKKLVGDATAQ